MEATEIMESKSPIVEINSVKLSEGYYRREGKTWSVPILLKYVEERGYKPFKVPVAGIDIGYLPWSIKTMKDFITHATRALNSDLSYPILLDDTGCICDGTHRLCKAILEGKTEIDAIRLQKMPLPDAEEDEK